MEGKQIMKTIEKFNFKKPLRYSKKSLSVDIKRKCKQCKTVVHMNDPFDLEYSVCYDTTPIGRSDVNWICPVCNKTNKIGYFQAKHLAEYIQLNDFPISHLIHAQLFIRNNALIDPYFLYETICYCRLLNWFPEEVTKQPLFDKITEYMDSGKLPNKIEVGRIDFSMEDFGIAFDDFIDVNQHYATQKNESGIKHHLELLDSVRSELNSKNK